MASYLFETITAQQAAGYNSAVDSLSFSDPDATYTSIRVSVTANSVTLQNSAGRTLVFGAGFQSETLTFNDGTVIEIDSGGSVGLFAPGLGQAARLIGRGGFDALNGGPGDDFLQGGAEGGEQNQGAGGRDTFVFFQGDAGTSGPDFIDFTTSWEAQDFIATPLGFIGPAQYAETTSDSYANAFAAANALIATGTADAVAVQVFSNTFVFWDSAQNNGNADDAFRLGTTTLGQVDFGNFVALPPAALVTPGETTSGDGGPNNISGNLGADSLSGGTGGDTLSGGFGDDTLDGGDDSDRLIGGDAEDLLDGGAGQDTADYAGVQGDLSVNLQSGQASGEGFDTLTGVENVTGGFGHDTLLGNNENNLLDGGSGDDTLDGGDGGSETLQGGFGHDVLRVMRPFGGPNGAVLSGGDGDDSLAIGAGAGVTLSATLTAGDGQDTITISGAASSGFVDLGSGDDRLVLSGSSGNVSSVSLGGGADTVRYELGFGLFAGAPIPGLLNLQDYNPGVDQITTDLSMALQAWNGVDNPFTTGHLAFVEVGGDSFLRYDRDGGGNSFTGLIRFIGRTPAQFPADSLIFGFTPPVLSTASQTLSGTAGMDTVQGGFGPDSLSGLAGSDSLSGGGDVDADTLSGGLGQDTLAGGDGPDLFLTPNGDSNLGAPDHVSDWTFGDRTSFGSYVGAANIYAETTAGSVGAAETAAAALFALGQINYAVYEVAGDLYVFADSGDDNGAADSVVRIVGRGLADIDHTSIAGGPQTGSTLSGTGVDDSVFGGVGDDSLSGLNGQDSLVGRDGADTLSGGGGDDALYGGAGADRLDGGAGEDGVSYESASGPVTVNLATQTASGADGVDTLVSIEGAIGGGFADTLTGDAGPNFLGGGNSGGDRIDGAGGDDFLFSSAQGQMLFGGTGDDMIIVFGGLDTIDGGAGVDVISLAESTAGASLALGGPRTTGLEAVVGSDFGDTLAGAAGAETLDGGDGGDILTGGGGVDVLTGGLGADVFIVGGSDSPAGALLAGIDRITDWTSADDRLRFAGGPAGAAGNYEEAVVGSYAAAQAAAAAGFGTGKAYFAAEIGADTVVFSAAAGQAILLANRDLSQIDFGAIPAGLALPPPPPSDPPLILPPPPPPPSGGSPGLPTPQERGTATSDSRSFGSAADSYDAGGGADTIEGGEGDDLLYGGEGDDQMFGGPDNDTIVGGEGDNLLRGGEGSDRVVGGSAFDNMHGNQGDDFLLAGDGGDWVVGGQGSDILFGQAGGDLVYGQLGQDTLSGGMGDDGMAGGQADDILRGDEGNDFISGDRGADTLTGGLDADTFHTFAQAGIDRVTDFRASEGDRVLIDAGTEYVLRQEGADTVIDMGGGNRMVLEGVQLSTLPASWIFS